MNDFANPIAIGDSKEIFAELGKPHVMAAVWTGAWSEVSMQFVADLTAKEVYRKPGQQLPLRDIPELCSLAAIDTAKDFLEECSVFYSLFKKLGLQVGSNKFVNASRMERPEVRSDSDWHLDPGRLQMIAVPIGVTTEYLETSDCVSWSEKKLKISVDDIRAASMARSLPNNALTIFKGDGYPGHEGRVGFVHRRPGDRILPCQKYGRYVMHCHVM